MTTTFITGANKSLGLETARRLAEKGHRVLIGARDPERGRAAAAALGARFVRIDVTDEASVAAAAADVAAHEGSIDVLVNNAGVLGRVDHAERYTAADASAAATDFTGGLGHSVGEGAESIVALATIGPDGPTGQFVDRSGTLPW